MHRQYCPVSEIAKARAAQKAHEMRSAIMLSLPCPPHGPPAPIGDPAVAISALIAATICKPRQLATYAYGSNAGGGGGLAFDVQTEQAPQLIANLRAAGARVDDYRGGDRTTLAVKSAVRVNQNDSGVGSWPSDRPTWKLFQELESAAQAWNRPANWQAGAAQRLYELDHKADTPERSIIRQRIQAGIDSARPCLDGLTEMESWEAGYRWLDTWHVALGRDQRDVGDLGVTLCGDRLGPKGHRLCGGCANRWAERGGSEPIGCGANLE